MKIKIIATLFITGLYALSSCSKNLLEEEIYSQPVEEKVKGKIGAALLTNGIYGFLQFYGYYRGGGLYLLDTEAGTDEFYCNWGSVDTDSWGGNINFLNMNAAHFQVQKKWDHSYKIIAQCNDVINKFSSENDKDIVQNVAQAKFWRAYAYTKLYNVYGAVPLIKGNEDQSNGIAKASVAELESFIESELKSVMSVLPPSYSTSDYGRPTSWAVKAFLARFYLDRHKWREASDLAKDVITNGGFSLMPEYQDIFGKNGNDEVILAINHIAQSDRGNKYVALSVEAKLNEALEIKGVSASNGFGMAVQFYQTFNANDKRIAPYDRNTGKGIAMAGIIRDAEGKPAYGDKDNPKTVEDALHRVVTCKWPVLQNIPRGEDAPLNVPLLRLGETMLTYAEAQNELGNWSEAAIYLKKIRERSVPGSADITAADPASMRKAILDERGWELYHEGYRREDLMRAGSDVYLAKMNEKAMFYLKKPLPWGADARRILNPIPVTALQINPLLKQNPGYD
ncbi:MAG: RagB/SusD family nutrient uptake outer membrane protein [Candidatus Nephrothrix sp. EaCA]|nr:MAG: RagB/SusD family nutrient uptake outer membrane protein [Candidatus Nephrothrix sp. EaCA]